jgi:hypothetical protein
MPRVRQLSVWVALGLWAAVVTGDTIYGAWQAYAGRALVDTTWHLLFRTLWQA